MTPDEEERRHKRLKQRRVARRARVDAERKKTKAISNGRVLRSLRARSGELGLDYLLFGARPAGGQVHWRRRG